MVRNIEKLVKIEHPTNVSELPVEPIKMIHASTINLDLVNLEPYTEPSVPLNIDLGLDQLEETDE